MQGVQYASGRSVGGLSEAGKRRAVWALLLQEGRVEEAAAAHREFIEWQKRNGLYGRRLHLYADDEPRATTSAVRASSGGSLVGEMLRLRLHIAQVRREAALAQLDARRRLQRQRQQRTHLTDDGGRLVYHEDAFDDDDWDVVVTEDEQRQEMRSLIG